MLRSFQAMGDWAMGGGSTTIVNESPRGGSHYDPKGSRRKVVFKSDGPTYRKPGSVVSSSPATPSPGKPVKSSPRISLGGEYNNNGTGRTRNPHPPASASRMAPANPTARPPLPRSSAPTINPHTRNNPSPGEVASMRSNPRNARGPAPIRFSGSKARADDRLRASEFTSGERDRKIRTDREHANDPAIAGKYAGMPRRGVAAALNNIDMANAGYQGAVGAFLETSSKIGLSLMGMTGAGKAAQTGGRAAVGAVRTHRRVRARNSVLANNRAKQRAEFEKRQQKEPTVPKGRSRR